MSDKFQVADEQLAVTLVLEEKDLMENLADFLLERIDESRAAIARLAADLKVGVDGDATPHYVFTWMDKAFYHAARLHAYQPILELVLQDPGQFGTEWLRQRAGERALFLARSPRRSTSTCSNFLEQNLCQVWAELADDLRRTVV